MTRAFRGSAQQVVERRIREYLDARDVLLVDSGTSGLRLAIGAATDGGRLGPVALPAYCCYDVATAAIGAGARVRLYDVSPRTLSLEPASLAGCMAEGVAAVVVAHLYGLPVDMPRVRALADRAGVVLIEDVAQALGAEVGGRPAGAWGSVAVMSFGRGKGLTGGGGGALAATDGAGREVLGRARNGLGGGGAGLVSWAGAVSQYLLGRPSLYGVPSRVPLLHLGETRYRVPWNPAGMAAVPATVLAQAWERLAGEVVARQENARRLLRAAEARLAPFQVVPGAVPSYLRLPLLTDPAVGGEVAAGRWRDLGLARGYPLALSDLPALRESMAPPVGACPGAKVLAGGLVTVPTHSLLKEGDLVRLEGWLEAVTKGGPAS